MKRLISSLPSRSLASILTGALTLMPTLAMAHPGHFHPGEEDEFDALTAGFLHPLSGMDHLALALAAGCLAVLFAGKNVRLPFFAFLVSLVAGAYAGRGFHASSGIEIAIAFTLVAAGAAFGMDKKPKPLLLIGAVSIAGFIHGFAHGAEASTNMAFSGYVAGFVAATAILFGMGSLVQALLSNTGSRAFPRIAGAALFALGSFSLIQAL